MKDIRDFIAECEKEGELRRIKAEVDWNLELSHTAKIVEEKQGAALLFENVKGYKTPVLSGTLATSRRLAIAMGLPVHYSIVDLAQEWMKVTTTKDPVKPKFVNDGPILENLIEGDKVNLFDFPVPFFNVKDGGRYIGTWVYLISKDPDTGWVNLGTYRMQLHDKNRIGTNFIGGKHANLMLKQYKEMGKKMPAAVVIGSDPMLFLVASTLLPYQTNEYDIAGLLRGEPVEVIESDLTGLPIPAHAEIVIEGEIDPENLHSEGPFAEYTGYYSGTVGLAQDKPFMEVKRVLHRDNPIFCVSITGKPIGDTNVIIALNHTATLWADLETMKIPGLEKVYVPENSAGRYWAIVSLNQKYPGHAMQVGTAVISTTTGSYGLKGVIVVDDDIRVDDWNEVMWALSVRYDPKSSTQIIDRGRSTPLDPSLPIGARKICSRIIMDATLPFEWEQKPIPVALDKDMVNKVKGRFKEFDLEDFS